MTSKYQFLIDTYITERVKTLAIWQQFQDQDLRVRPNRNDKRGRNLLEQMVHQCISEDLWFKNMLEIDVDAPPLPDEETRQCFIQQYQVDSQKRVDALQDKNDEWWEGITSFFGEARIRAWVMTRRIAHSSHHRGQLTYLLRMIGEPLYSTYGPTADTGGLFINKAPTIYAFGSEKDILNATVNSPLPDFPKEAVTERPD